MYRGNIIKSNRCSEYYKIIKFIHKYNDCDDRRWTKKKRFNFVFVLIFTFEKKKIMKKISSL